MPHRNGTGIELLADPTRRRLIAALAIRPARPSRLADLLELSRFTVSRHLRLLREAGLVVGHRLVGDSRGVLYTIDSRRHGAITAWLAGTDVAGTLDPAAAAGIPPGRRTVNDPWRACGSGRVRVVFLKRTPRRSDIPARRFRGHCGQTQSSAH